MQIIQELKTGTPIFKVLEDGTETVELKPPTSKELRAARALESLHHQLQGMARSLESLQRQLETVENYLKIYSVKEQPTVTENDTKPS